MCDHKFNHMGLQYADGANNIPGGGAKRRYYAHVFFCERCLEKRAERVVTYVTVKKDLVQCEPVYVSFGELVKAKRLERGLTQTELADMVGLSRTSVTNIEIGRQRVLLSDLFVFAKAFDVSPLSMFKRLSE